MIPMGKINCDLVRNQRGIMTLFSCFKFHSGLTLSMRLYDNVHDLEYAGLTIGMIMISGDPDEFLDNNGRGFLGARSLWYSDVIFVKGYLQFEQIYGSNCIRISLFIDGFHSVLFSGTDHPLPQKELTKSIMEIWRSDRLLFDRDLSGWRSIYAGYNCS